MSHDIDNQKERLRQYLNKSISGPNTDIILESLAEGSLHLIHNVEAVNDQLYIVSAKERYLDQRMADRNITRPDNVGLSDEVFQELGIDISNRKQVRDLVHSILETMYGQEATRATSASNEFETYALEDGDTLIMKFDDEESIEIVFTASQFTNISAATAQEVADAITKNIRKLGRRGSAITKDDGAGGYVLLVSETVGPSSTVQVLGGKAQNKIKFASIKATSGEPTTQWTFAQVSGGKVRATWTGGPNPSIGKVNKNDYANIYGTSFDELNRGTFQITDTQGGLVGDAYVEFENPNGVPEVVLQGDVEGILFFNSTRKTINSKTTFAAAYQTESRLLEVFMPATTKVVRRDRVGAAHLHDTGASAVDSEGPYVFDISKPYVIGGEECNTTQKVDSSTDLIISVDDSSDIPDDTGHLVFGFGTSKEEGPVPYIARPSSNSLLINPSYRFQNVHESGTNISLIAQNYAYDVDRDGTDIPFYLTDVVSGRTFAEDLVNSITATGIRVLITILYPEDIGLSKWGTPNSGKFKVWGE